MAQDVYSQMKAAVQTVARARERAAKEAAYLASERAAFDGTHTELIEAVAREKQAVADAELMLRSLVGAHYDMTGEKKPVAGVEVKERTKRTITDRAAALAWARQSGMALIPEDVDEKAVLKIASVTPLPFVTVTTEPQVNIDSTLPTEDNA